MDAVLFLLAVALGIILGWLLFGALPPLPTVTGAHSADDDEPEEDDDWTIENYLMRNEAAQPMSDREAADAINRHNGVPGWRPGEEWGE